MSRLGMLTNRWLVFPTLLVLTCVGLAQAGEARVLSLYNWSDYVGKHTISHFEQRFAVKVKQDLFASNEELLAKLQAGVKGYDIIVPSDYMVRIMSKLGLLEPLDKAKLPNLTNLDERFRHLPYDPGEAYAIPYAWGTSGIGIREDKVDAPVVSLGTLFDPRYRRKLTLLDDMRETIGMALKYLGYSVNTADPKALEEAKELLLRQKPLVKAYTSTQYKEMLLSGDAWLAHGWSGEITTARRENPHVRYIMPQEGGVIFIDNLAIPRTAPHKDLAHAFINFILEPEVSADIHNTMLFGSPNRAARPYLKPTLTDDPHLNPTPEMLARFEFLEDLGAATRLWTRTWTEIKAR
ncbi:MAG: spermidine/putrescine ABC transporter substrate-binding protein [Nitrospinae bacterium]|nr:spermidine/putrescine ABC transporter substrate-binding protein [Nitrospinota bacterium]